MKAELRKQYRDLYKAAASPRLLNVPALPYLTVDGDGEPGGPQFQEAIAALYGTAYTLKFMLKPERDFDIMNLEGLWSCAGAGSFHWTLMMQMPPFITAAALTKAKKELAAKKGEMPALTELRLAKLKEGRAVQVMHVGPYDQVGQAHAALERFMTANGLESAGRHHEIYISDPRRTAPEKLKTVLRLPVRKAAQVKAAGA